MAGFIRGVTASPLGEVRLLTRDVGQPFVVSNLP